MPMCTLAKYAEQLSHNAVTNEMANDFNIKANSSGNAESYEINFLSKEYPCIGKSRRV